MYNVAQCCLISPISLAWWRSSGEGAEEVGRGRRRCGEGGGSWCCGCVCVCAGREGPFLAATLQRTRQQAPRSGDQGRRGSTPRSPAATGQFRTSLSSHLSPAPLRVSIVRAWVCLDHQIVLPAKGKKIQIGDDNVTGFETTTGGLCIQSEPCQRRRTGDESPEETPRRDMREKTSGARPVLPLVVFSPRLPLCLPQLLAIMGR